MAKFHGVGIQFGISSSLAGVTGQFQTRDHSFNSDMEEVVSSYGEIVATAQFKFVEEASFEYVATGAGPSGIVTVSLPSVGDLITVTDAVYTQIAQTNWIITKVVDKASNTGALKVTIDLKRYAGITS